MNHLDYRTDMSVKRVSGVFVLSVISLFFAPLIHGQDLSKYRDFTLGTSLADLSKQVHQHPADADVIQQSPATIQELTWRPSTESDPVQKIIFSLYNGKLYKIAAAYNGSATEGLTAQDMVQAISAKYGVATTLVVETSSPTNLAYGAREAPIAKWDNAQYSVTLSVASFLNTFQLVMLIRPLNDQAEAAIMEAAKREREDAPQKEIARVKKVADDLEIARQTNLKAFRP